MQYSALDPLCPIFITTPTTFLNGPFKAFLWMVVLDSFTIYMYLLHIYTYIYIYAVEVSSSHSYLKESHIPYTRAGTISVPVLYTNGTGQGNPKLVGSISNSPF